MIFLIFFSPFNSKYKAVVPDDYFTAYTTVNPMSDVGTVCKLLKSLIIISY
jgi:hypothetical protein